MPTKDKIELLKQKEDLAAKAVGELTSAALQHPNFAGVNIKALTLGDIEERFTLSKTAKLADDQRMIMNAIKILAETYLGDSVKVTEWGFVHAEAKYFIKFPSNNNGKPILSYKYDSKDYEVKYEKIDEFIKERLTRTKK